MPKNKKQMKDMHQIHGKIERGQPTTLDQIWGDTGISRYRTMDKTVYANSLSEMNKADLHAHSVKIGLVPIDDREVLTKRLMKEFDRYVAAYSRPANPIPQGKISKKKEISDKTVLNILAHGR